MGADQRNRLIHAYPDVNVALVWSTVISDLSELAPSTKRAALRLASPWSFKTRLFWPEKLEIKSTLLVMRIARHKT